MKLLEGKVAVVTGAARGIGKAIALKFAAEGADVAFTDLAIDENGKATEAELAALGVKAKGYASNAANFEETHKVIDEIVKDFGRIDILVNNAGITKDGLMMRMSEAQWDAVLTVNLKSAFNFIHAVTPVMARQKSGSIINMSSVVGVSGNAGQCNYSASKAGMIGLAKSIAKEMGPRGIRANAIAPGFIITDMTDKLPDEVKEGWYKQIPLRRGGTPEDVAKVALFLASDLSSYVSRRDDSKHGAKRGNCLLEKSSWRIYSGGCFFISGRRWFGDFRLQHAGIEPLVCFCSRLALYRSCTSV